jgi:sigma-E factor negative regulatory protein RseA
MKPELQRPTDDLQSDDPRPWLSALADGDAQALPQACKAWRDDPQARQAWHTYHLIGDVMRSEELAHAPAHDEAFLAGLRARLAAEPVVLAPQPAAVPVPRRLPWLLPGAVAAGFVVVAGVLVVVRSTGTGLAPEGGSLAAASAAGMTLVGNPGRSAPASLQANEAGVIRDARLDEYLRAHQAARGGVAVAAPGGTLRRVDATATVVPER